ncbi:heparinase II/III domain-containing protein [Vibrio natriegens]|uniref:heparinase II/III domain-containing protein n=1 Tax=Vibrio natriegens TaxID=691 RepID=UPI003B5A6178
MNINRVIGYIERKKRKLDDIYFIKKNHLLQDVCGVEIDEEYLHSYKVNIDKLFCNSSESNRKDVNDILQGYFNILGLKVKLTNSNFWNKDFHSGYIFDNKIYPMMKIRENQGYDVIIPWELSKFQFISILIKYYTECEDERIIDYCFEKVVDWYEDNKVGYGVNWISAMDSSLRAFNLVLLLSFLQGERKKVLVDIIYEHYRYLKRYVCKKKVGSKKHNHYLFELVGLYLLSKLFRDKEYIDISCENISTEFNRQFLSEGVNFEGATNYHVLALELGLFYLLISNEYKCRELYDTLVKAIEFTSLYMKIIGESPGFGDSCDSRVIVSEDYFRSGNKDHTYISNYVKALDLQVINDCSKVDFNGFWLFDKKYGLMVNGFEEHYNESGHQHSDKMSFVLSYLGKMVIIDSGTYCYTPNLSMRNKYRSYHSHNLCTHTDINQILFDEKYTFSKLCSYTLKSNYCSAKDECTLNMARFHDGSLECKRKFDIYYDELKITDIFEVVNSEDTAKVVFHFSSDFEIDLLDSNKIKLSSSDMDNYIIVKPENDYVKSIKVEMVNTSSTYMKEQKSNKVTFVVDVVKGMNEITTVLSFF